MWHLTTIRPVRNASGEDSTLYVSNVKEADYPSEEVLAHIISHQDSGTVSASVLLNFAEAAQIRDFLDGWLLDHLADEV